MWKSVFDPLLMPVYSKFYKNQKIHTCLEKSTTKGFKIYFMDTDVICVKLQSLDRLDRQNGLKLLLEFCENQLTKSDTLISVYDDCYIHILKCYSDKYENCRELACKVITGFIKRLPKNEYYLQHIINEILLRCGQMEIQEQSEEMRLIYLQQMNFLIDKFRCDKLDKNDDDNDNDNEDGSVDNNHKARKGDFLLKSYDKIIDILLKTLTDPYPVAQREACDCIKQLALATPSFHYRAETLTKPLLSMLYHKHSTNRIAAIESLGIICLHILTNSDCVVQIISEISPLLMDPMPLVRKECGKIGCMWLLKLRDRYSYFERILPLPLCCLNDDSPEVRQHIEELWLKCGQQYFEENENELNKIEILDRQADNYPKDVKRPTLGCRALVQRNLKLIKSVMYETRDWKEDVKLHSLKLLWQIVIHAETVLTAKFMEIYPDLCTVCADSDVNVCKAATKVAELMGNLLNSEDWFQFALEHLEQHPKIGCLKCFYFLYLGSNSKKYSENILATSKVLAKKELSNTLTPEVQMYLLKLIDILLERYQFQSNTDESIETAMAKMKLENDETEKYLYHTLIKIIALSIDDVNPDNVIQAYGQELLQKFVKYKEELIPILHNVYLNSVIETFDSLDAELDEFAEPILLLYGVIRMCGFQKNYLNSLKKSIQTVWEHGRTDAKIKIFTAISIAILKWKKTMYDVENVSDDNISLLQEFVKDIIEPHLLWKPGACAESLRSMATMALCSLTQGTYEEAPKVLPEFALYFQNLIEDNSTKTRIYAGQCLMNFGPMKYEYLRPIAYGVIERLDDSCPEVRKWAIKVLCKFDSSAIQDDEIDSWHTFIKCALKSLFIHFDEHENVLKNLIKDSLLEIGKQYPDLFSEPYNEALKTTLYVEEIKEICKEIKMFNKKK